jgi:hypothetical protein
MTDTPRVLRPNRAQIELRPSDLESLLSEDHRARAIWEFVEGLDLSALYEGIRAVEGPRGTSGDRSSDLAGAVDLRDERRRRQRAGARAAV